MANACEKCNYFPVKRCRCNELLLQAKIKKLEEEKKIEIQVAQKLCKLYFEIAEEFIDADEIRKKRDRLLKEK